MVRRALSLAFFFWEMAAAQALTTAAHWTSARTVTTYKKMAIFETWSEPSPLQKHIWISLKKMVREVIHMLWDGCRQQRREFRNAELELEFDVKVGRWAVEFARKRLEPPLAGARRKICGEVTGTTKKCLP